MHTMRTALIRSLRELRARPAFAVTIVATLGLCFGTLAAATAVLSSTLLRPLPFPAAEALDTVGVRVERGAETGYIARLDGAEWALLREGAPGLAFAAYSETTTQLNMGTDTGAGYVAQRRVGAGFFSVFGLPLGAGREFTADEDRPGGPAVVVLGHDLWQRAFGARMDVVGRTVAIAGQSHQVVGVAPPGWPDAVDVWMPLRADVAGEGAGRNYAVVARRAPGVSPAAAASTLQAASAALEAQSVGGIPVRRAFEPRPFREQFDAPLRAPLGIALAMVAVVLVLGCFNVAGMLLARASERAGEHATRLALGAARRHLVVQALADALVPAWIGGLAGLALGALLLRAMQSVLPEPLVAIAGASLDYRVAVATLGVASACGIAMGLAVAPRARRLDWQAARGGARSTDGAGMRTRGRLVAAQIALTVAALVATGLLYRGFDRLARLDPGFNAEGVLAAGFALRDARYTEPAAILGYYERVLARLAALPGVESAAVSLTLPYEAAVNDAFAIDGVADAVGAVNVNYASPDYFAALRIPLLQGRLPDARDHADAERVAVVNAAFARRWFADGSALDRRVELAGEPRRIIGVVGDTVEQANWGGFGLLDRPPAAIIPVAQTGARMPLYHTWFSPNFVVRGVAGARVSEAAIAQAVAAVDPALPVARFRTPVEVRHAALAMPRFMAALVGTVGALALLLAAIGVYGMVRQAVVARTREFGVRLALGATPAGLAGSALSPVLRALAMGAAVGLVGAWAGARGLASLLHGVPAHDAVALSVAFAVVAVVVIAAAMLPARRVARLDPVLALRGDP